MYHIYNNYSVSGKYVYIYDLGEWKKEKMYIV